MERVYVLLSTYNGEKYLRRQLDSILLQKDVDVQLVIRDDGSTDATLSIIHEYQQKWKNIILHEEKNVGYIKSFMWLVNHCEYEEGAFYAFSDQDDVWDLDKLSAAVTKLKQQEPDKPLLYYSDLKIVDAEENFIRRANDWEGRIDKYMLSVFIGIRGCTMVYNSVLQKLLKDYEIKDISGHDTYVALIAFWLGKVIYDDTPHINYRQTGENLSLTGVSKFDKLKKNFVYLKKRFTVRKNMHEKNAKELLSHYEGQFASELQELKMVADYKRNVRTRLRMLFAKKFKNFSLVIRLFNDLLIVAGKL